MNNCTKFDPLVAAGILPFPAMDMINGKAPFISDIQYNPNIDYKPDSFTPSCQRNGKPSIKGCVLTALFTALAILGLQKYGKKPLSILKNIKPFDAIKNCFKKIRPNKP